MKGVWEFLLSYFFFEVYIKIREGRTPERSWEKLGEVRNWEKFEPLREVYFKSKEVWEKLGEIWTNSEKFRKTERSKREFKRNLDKLRVVYFKIKGVWEKLEDVLSYFNK